MSEKILRRFQREDEARWRAAVQQLGSSPDLRFFFRELAARCGYGQPVYSGNALQTANAAGRQDLLNELIAAITEVDPAFWPGLLKEMNDDRRYRTDQLAQSANDRGD